MQYAVYQFRLNDEQRQHVDEGGWEAAPEHYLDIRDGTATPEQYRSAFPHFTHVANVEARDLEDVFETGNGFGSGRLERIAPRMTSVSVGDLVHDLKEDQWYSVAGVGFDRIGQIEKFDWADLDDVMKRTTKDDPAGPSPY